MKIVVCLLTSLLLSFCLASGKSEVGFDKRQIVLGQVKLEVEIADTDERRSQGLMYRQKMTNDCGMLFIFSKEKPLSFWMKNTFIPLSIGFFDKNRKLIEVQEMKPMKSLMEKQAPLYQSRKPAKYALEVNQGWFKKHKITMGTKWEWVKQAKIR